MAMITAGDVPIELAGETRILRPTLRAITNISQAYGGLAKARAALAEQDFAAAVTVIRWGVGMSDNEAKRLPDLVYDTGLTIELLLPLIRYIGILANGGKPLPDEPLDADAEDASAVGNVLN
jgi:hypothetical protein